MSNLDALAQNRVNTLNLIRVIAATAVLVSHAWPIALGPGTPEPLFALTGQSLGTLSVSVFFVISGFLIAQSFERTSSRKAFLMARVLRLWPALIVCTLWVALAYGTFWLAYIPGGVVRQFNRVGDYSYGIYIYAFPLQGAVVWFYGPMTPWMNVALALPPTLFCAVLSWHLIEKPALAQRKGLMRRRLKNRPERRS